jgi:hypothetical protein
MTKAGGLDPREAVHRGALWLTCMMRHGQVPPQARQRLRREDAPEVASAPFNAWTARAGRGRAMPASAGTGPKPRSRLRQAVPRLRWYWERCIADGQTDPVKAIQPRTGVALSLPPNIRAG